MKLKTLKLAVIPLAAAGLLAGCAPSEPTTTADGSPESVPPANPPSAAEVKEQVQEAAEATKEYVAANKDEFVAHVNQRLADLDARIADLAQKSAGLKDDARTQADQALAALKQQREELRVQFEQFKQASAETWKDMRAGLAAAMEKMEQAYEKTKSRFFS